MDTGHTPRRWLRLLRRSAALGMSLSALWLMGLTTTLPSPQTLVQTLGGSSAFVVQAMASQLPTPPSGLEGTLDPWGRLLLSQSPLLRAGLDDVELRLSRQDEPLPAPVEIEDGENPEQTKPEPLPNTTVVEHTSLGRDDGSFLAQQEIYLKNDTDLNVDITALAAQPLELTVGDGPQILIYHTHGSEAYTQTEQTRYTESDSYRTTDCTRNVVRVGEEMASVFRELGFEVIHDTTLYDYPVYSGSYQRSRAGVEQKLKEYPSIRLVLDVHRDALVAQDGSAYKLVAQEKEGKVAQIMLVVGSEDGGSPHPNWQKNLALAVQVQQQLQMGYTQLARPIVLRSTRYNQDVSIGSLLVEVGGHGNTLEEAIAGGRLFARSVGELLQTLSASSP